MEDDKELEKLLPQMNVNLPAPEEQQENNLVSNDMWLGICGEILNYLREERQEIDEAKNNFGEMIFNDGDSTSASKEAFTKLIELKSGISEKMTKVLDLATRVKLKEKDTFPRYLAAHQNNTIQIGDTNKREFLKQISKYQKKKKEENDKQN